MAEDKQLRDKPIRLAFIKDNLDFFKGENKEFANEFGINSTNVVDLASFDFNTNIFYGFEIKSEVDNLDRLYKQLTAYITFFHIVYVVAHEKHRDKIESLIARNKHLSNVGIILCNQNLEFTEIKRARKNKPIFSMFIKNLDLEEIKMLCEEKGVDILDGNKNKLISIVKRYTNMEELYEFIHHKVLKYRVKVCPKCGSKLYYNKILNGYKDSYCYECGALIS